MRTLLPTATVFVAEEEYDSYLAAGIPKERVGTHPNLLGLPRIRNFLCQRSEKRACIQIDDDLQWVLARAGHTQRKITDPETILEIIYGTAVMANDVGVSLFGWGIQPRPLYYKDTDPICLNGPFGGAIATIGKEARWDDRIIGGHGDPDAILRELLLRRIVYADRRYYFDIGKVKGGAGGLQDLRSQARAEETKDIFLQKWGSYVSLDQTQPGVHIGFKVKRRQDWTI
jgi:hypothetical protein